mmetsp:Transcript_4017/g.4932  ORF Transcript_4017/g.4932 Transcript_4017/m.4932 type:complete len:121 (+) Transcript_4017:118-480(+)
MEAQSDIETPFLENQETNRSDEAEAKKISLCRLIQRILIGVIGVFLGLATMLPNAMMAATSPWAARVGVLASAAFGFGGIYGAIKVEWKWLFVGLFIQVLALLVGFGGLENPNNVLEVQE